MLFKVEFFVYFSRMASFEFLTVTGVVLVIDLFAYREYLRYKYAFELEGQKSTVSSLTFLNALNQEINEPLSKESEKATASLVEFQRVETVFVPDTSALSLIQELRSENISLKARLSVAPSWSKMLFFEIENVSGKIAFLNSAIASVKTKLHV